MFQLPICHDSDLLRSMVNLAGSSSHRERVFATLAIAVLVAAGLAGLVDHLVTDSAVQLADLQAHYCIHGPRPPGVDCNAVDPDGLARAWHWREAAYAAVMVAASVAVIGLLLRSGIRSRRSMSLSSSSTAGPRPTAAGSAAGSTRARCGRCQAR